jgi:hypothetical protein
MGAEYRSLVSEVGRRSTRQTGVCSARALKEASSQPVRGSSVARAEVGRRSRTRKSRGSLGRSLNPLGTLAQSVSGRGPDSEWSFLPLAEASGRVAIRRSLFPSPGSSASRETRRPGTARRSRRIPVRRSERPRCPRFPDDSGSRSTASERLSPLRTSWLGPPPGFPFGVAGKVDRHPTRGNSGG